jgi:DNA mismatch repair ATPase MutS
VYAKIAELYLNICDTTGKESLFQAEMHRAQKLITHLKELQAHEFAFIILDEIFTATNTTEGIAGAYGIAKKITRYNQCCYLIATHFLKLTELEQDTQEIYKNYQIRVCKNSDGSFIYLYTLKPGINDQAIALELLKQEGFDPDILEEAYKILGQS